MSVSNLASGYDMKTRKPGGQSEGFSRFLPVPLLPDVLIPLFSRFHVLDWRGSAVTYSHSRERMHFLDLSFLTVGMLHDLLLFFKRL